MHINNQMPKTTNNILTNVYTNLCTKLVVPSIGSIIQVGSSVRMHFCPTAVDSSPMKLNYTNTVLKTFSLKYSGKKNSTFMVCN